MTSNNCVPSFSIIWICSFKSQTSFVLYIVYDKIRVDPSVHLALMIKRCIQRLQRSIPIKRFKCFNTREYSISTRKNFSFQNPFILYISQQRWDHRRVAPSRSNIHMHIRATCLSVSSATISYFRDSILFTEVCRSSIDETRWNSFVVIEHLHFQYNR